MSIFLTVSSYGCCRLMIADFDDGGYYGADGFGAVMQRNEGVIDPPLWPQLLLPLPCVGCCSL